MKRILITGCAGFLASHLVERLQGKTDTALFGITDVPMDSAPHMEVFPLDICDAEALGKVIKKISPELLFHFAAVTNVGFSWKHPALTYEVNFLGSSLLFDTVRRVNPDCRVLVMSSAEIYRKSDSPVDESGAVDCLNPYSLSKYAMEMLVDLHVAAYRTAAVKVRSYNFTGPGQSRRFVASDFAAQIAAVERGEQEPVIRVGNLEAVRDFSDVRDVARYLSVLAEKAPAGSVYNICSGKSLTIREMLEILLSFAKVPIRVEIDPGKLRPLDTPVMKGDCSNLRKDFGLEPEFPIERSLSDLLDYWRSGGNG